MIRRQQGGRGNGDDMVLSIRGFQAGAIAGATLIGIMWAGTVWWTAKSARSPGDEVLYDSCLVSNKGNIITCDAVMRTIDRERALEKMLKAGGAKMLAAGHSKREVVKWATSMGGVGSQLSDAAGISLTDLQADKY